MEFDSTKRNALLLAGVGTTALMLSNRVALADQNFTSFGFAATGGTTLRTDPDRWGVVADPKNYGAVGDGMTDDTAAIQRCFDDALGTWASPNGLANVNLNKEIVFTGGTYLVSTPKTTTITNIVSGASGWCLCTVASTVGFATDDMCYVRGVVGVPNANFSYGIQVVSAGTPGTILLRNATFSNAYVSGGTITQPCLRIRGSFFNITGPALIVTGSPNCAVLTLNGVQGHITNMAFSGGDIAGTIGLDYNWDGVAGVSSQSCGFYNLSCFGSDYGLAIGMGQAMCSETTIFKCFFSGRTGVIVANQNALSQSIYGGNISGCKDYGLYVSGGSFQVIQGVAFQSYGDTTLSGTGYIGPSSTTLTLTTANTRHPGVGFEIGDLIHSDTPGITAGTTIVAQLTGPTGGAGTYTVSNSQTFASSGSPATISVGGKADIYIPQGQNDCVLITGCRSESFNFAWLPYLQPYLISACSHFNDDPEHFFYNGAAEVKMSACRSGCWLNPSSGTLEIDSSCEFLATDYWRHNDAGNPNDPAFLSITPQPVTQDTTTGRVIKGPDNGCLVQFTNSSAITYTLEPTDGSFTRLRTGSFFDLQQMGTGQITVTPASGAVTVTAPTAQMTITTRTRYSRIRVTVTDAASNTYSVSGDITP